MLSKNTGNQKMLNYTNIFYLLFSERYCALCCPHQEMYPWTVQVMRIVWLTSKSSNICKFKWSSAREKSIILLYIFFLQLIDRFYQGRRTADDDRQIGRWLRCAGRTGRWRNNLISKCVKSNASFDNHTISPVVRQTLQHWGYRLTKEDYEAYAKQMKRKGLAWMKCPPPHPTPPSTCPPDTSPGWGYCH